MEIDRDVPGDRDVLPDVPAGEEGEEEEEWDEGQTDEQGHEVGGDGAGDTRREEVHDTSAGEGHSILGLWHRADHGAREEGPVGA